MADAIILSQDTYDRLMAMLEKWEDGDIIKPGKGLAIEEQGTGYEKLGLEPVPETSTPGSVAVTDGTTTVSDVTLISFDSALFTVSDAGGGEADVTLQTETC